MARYIPKSKTESAKKEKPSPNKYNVPRSQKLRCKESCSLNSTLHTPVEKLPVSTFRNVIPVKHAEVLTSRVRYTSKWHDICRRKPPKETCQNRSTNFCDRNNQTSNLAFLASICMPDNGQCHSLFECTNLFDNEQQHTKCVNGTDDSCPLFTHAAIRIRTRTRCTLVDHDSKLSPVQSQHDHSYVFAGCK